MVTQALPILKRVNRFTAISTSCNDEAARAACYEFAKRYGCWIENKPERNELWFGPHCLGSGRGRNWNDVLEPRQFWN